MQSVQKSKTKHLLKIISVVTQIVVSTKNSSEIDWTFGFLGIPFQLCLFLCVGAMGIHFNKAAAVMTWVIEILYASSSQISTSWSHMSHTISKELCHCYSFSEKKKLKVYHIMPKRNLDNGIQCFY